MIRGLGATVTKLIHIYSDSKHIQTLSSMMCFVRNDYLIVIISYGVITILILFRVAVLCVNIKRDNTPVPLLQVHPPSASHILLPDGRNMSYLEQGVSANRARYLLVAPHSFLSSRLAGKSVKSDPIQLFLN